MANKNDLFEKYKTIEDLGLSDEEENESENNEDIAFDDFKEAETTEVFDEENEVMEQEAPKAKKVKEKKVKEPKPVKEKKAKEPKPVKEKKAKQPKSKKKDADFEEQLTKKDHLTFVLILVTLVVAIAFVAVKFLPVFNSEEQKPTETTTEMANISSLRVDREDVMFQYIQSDMENLFYSWSPENVLQYYQYSDKKIKAIQPTGKMTFKVKMGEEELNVTLDYVQLEKGLFGIGLFSADQAEPGAVYKKVVFKLTNLPSGYEQEGKALLLATTDKNAISEKNNRWTDSFVVDIESGKTTRFLSNNKTDFEEASGFSVLTNEAYMTTDGKIPFFTTRKYEAISGKRDIFIKEGTKEYAFAEDVYGNYVFVDGPTIIYMKATETGFNVVKKDAEEEFVVFTLEGDFNLNYLYHKEYLLDKISGKLYNVKTGTETQIEEYKMLNPESITVSANGKNLAVLGTVKNVVDYQLYIFNLETGKCTKYEDTNFSKHTNITFVDDTMVMITAVSPEKGYENVIIDIAKGNKK